MLHAITHYQLDNGLQVILIPDSTSNLVSVRTYVKAGSISEEQLLGAGASHYLEHLVAGGTTEKRSEDEYKSIISNLGGAFNAYTTLDHTSYFLNTTTDYTQTAITTLYEWMFYNAFQDSEFERERLVIQKEIEKNEANLARKFYQLSQNNLYKRHPIKFPVIGYLENFNAIKKEELVAYYKKYYVPSNMVLLVGGDIDIPQVKELIANTFGTQVKKAAPQFEFYNEPRPFSQRVVEVEAPTQVTMMSIKFPTIDLFSPDLYPLDLLDYILGNGDDSVLYKRLVEEKKLAYSVNASSYTPSFTKGYFEIYVECDYSNKEAVIEEIKQSLKSVAQGKIKEKDIEKSRNQKLSEDIFGIQNIDDKVSKYGSSMISADDPYMMDNYIKNFETVTKKDIQAVTNAYFDWSKAAISIMAPEGTLASENKTEQAAKEQSAIVHKLSNGIKVVFYKDTSLPRVYSKVFLAGGLRAETAKNNGLGYLMTDLWGTETTHYSKERIQDLVNTKGASLSASLGNNTFYLSLESLEKDFADLLPIQLDAVIHPVFSDVELDISKHSLMKKIDQREDDWRNITNYLFKKKFFDSHPYSLSRLGEKESVTGLTTKDIAAYYNRFIDPNQIVVSVYGDFDDVATLKTLENALSKLKAGQNTFDLHSKEARQNHAASHEERVPIKQEVSVVIVGYDGITIEDHDLQEKIDLVDTVLSGTNYPGGRLHNILRDKGYVYMVHAVSFTGLEKGYFKIVALTSPDKAEEVKRIILEQVEDIKTNPISDIEFKEAIAQMKYYNSEKNSTTETLSMVSATDVLYGFDANEYQKAAKKIDQLTIKDVQETAQAYLVNPQIYIFQPEEK